MSQLNENNLHKYQKRAVDFIIDKKRAALFIDMGLGKTISTLTAIEKIKYDLFDVDKVLIIAPLRVCNTVWEQEAKKWKHTSHLTFSNLSGGRKNMLKGLMKKADIYLINRENAPALVNHLGTKWDFDMVVIDESSSFKSHATKRFRAMKRILHKTHYMVLLTGTPNPNGYLDLWSQFYLIDGGERLFNTISKYRSRYFDSDYMGYNYTLRHGAMKQIHDKISDVVLSMSAKDYLTLPKVINNVVYQPLSGKLLKYYEKLEKEMMLQLKEGTITAMTAATLTNKLLQFCSGNIYNEDKVEHIHTLKIDMLKDILEDNPNENFLIAYNYKHELEQLQKHFKYAKKLDKDPKTVEEWNKGNIKLLLAHPASAGHGLNLQYGGHNIVWYGFTWSLELYQQFNARLNRQGQTRPVTITHLAVGEIEKRLMETLTKKEITQKELLAALA